MDDWKAINLQHCVFPPLPLVCEERSQTLQNHRLHTDPALKTLCKHNKQNDEQNLRWNIPDTVFEIMPSGQRFKSIEMLF